MQSTLVAEVLDALVERFRADLPDVEVTDGQPLNIDAPLVLTVGFSVTRPAAEIVQESSDLADNRDEALSIVCLASSLRGDVEMSMVRQEAVAILDSVRASLQTDDTLGGLVDRAELGYGLALDQAQTPDGASATVEFTVAVSVM